MQLELILGNEPRALPVAQTFTRETLRLFPLSADVARGLGDLAIAAVKSAVEHAYPEGEEGTIQLTLREEHGRLEILVRDWGMPQDVAVLERELHQPGPSTRGLIGSDRAGLADEVHWLGFGPQGKAFQILEWLHDTHIEGHPEAGSLEPFQEDVPRAPDQQYAIRRMRPEEAVQVAQLMYRAYGNTYFNADVYYPERIAAQNARGALLSIVAQGEDGHLAGHCALEFQPAGRVAEVGQAVVDPAHRGRGLMNRMKEAILEEAQKRDLAGWYANAVAVHVLTQKLNVSHGGHVCGVSLGVSPKTERFRNLAEQLTQRVSCILYYHWLGEPTPRTVHAPARHHPILSAIYENLQCPAPFAEGTPPSGQGTLTVKMIGGAGAGFLRAEQLGADTARSIRHAKRTLVEQARAEAVFVELPLSDPGTAHVAEELEGEGFGFAGVAPDFSARGDLLQLVYLVEPLAREPIHTYEELAARLVAYALKEQERLQNL